MDRLSQMRGEAGGSGDSTLDTTSPPSEAFISANENSSKYFSINDSTFDITPIKDVSLASTSADADRSIAGSDELISNLSPIGKKELDSYKIGKQIEAANILSGGVDIFDGNDNSFDGDELVIDDNMEAEEKDDNQAEVTPIENVAEPEPVSAEPETNVASREMEVVLQIDGNNVNAIDIGNGLYLYRKDGQDELAAIQIIDDDPQHSFKFLKVRDNAEGNLEVYEEIEIEVPKEVPTKEGKLLDKNTPHVPTIDIKKSISDSSSISTAEGNNKSPQKEPIASTSTSDKNTDEKETSSESKTEVNRNGKMMKFSDSRKSPVVGSFTPMTFHSTPNKEGKPLTKTMVDLQLDPNRHSDNVKKTIEVHTENIKQKPTELPAKEKDTLGNVKCVEYIPADKLSAEKSNKVNCKQDVKKDSPKKEDDQKQTEVVKCLENTEEIHKAEITTDKEESSIPKKLVIIDQNKDSTTKNSCKELIKDEMKSDNDARTDDAVVEKQVSPINDKESKVVVTNPDKLVVTLPPISKKENEKVISISETNQKLETRPVVPAMGQLKPVDMVIEPIQNINKGVENLSNQKLETGPVVPAMEQLMPVDMVIEPIQNINKGVEKPSENKSDLAECSVKAAKPVAIERVQNTTQEKKEFKKDKPSKIKILQNISLTSPTTSNLTDKPSTVKVDSHRVEISMKHDDDNMMKFPLESFSEVSSTCTNLGSEESKEESITLYSIDTDESVSLITPSSTTKIRDDKVVLSDNISEVLTTISNLSNIQTENRSVKNEKPVVKEFSVLTKARNEADSTSKISEQASSSKLEKTKIVEISNSQKDPKEVKERYIPVQETKLSEKATSSIPVPKVKHSEKSAPCNIVPKEKNSKVGHSTMMELKPHMNKAQPSLASEIKSSLKVALSEIKLLAKPAAVPIILASHTNPLEKPAKPAVSQDVKTVQPATKIESKPQEKSAVPGSVVNPAEKKYTVPPSAKITNTTSIPAKVKQSEISSTTSNKTVKPDSHIPVVSVANKPSSKLIPVISPKVEAIIKPVDNAASQKEIAKNNILDKKTTAIKNETREVKESIRKPNESKPVNNNHTPAVPFGKWTDAHRQEFVNKFKEVKAPHNTNSKQIKNSNDLNRRDVLQKIDSQRAQTISNATAKGQEKNNVKSETMFSSKVVSPTAETKSIPYSEVADSKLIPDSTKAITKHENPPKTTGSSTTPTSYAADVNAKMLGQTKPEPTGQTTFDKIEPTPKEQSSVSKIEPALKEQSTASKTEPVPKDQTSINKTETGPRDQNTASCYMASLIDRTIEDMINKVAPGKNADEPKPNIKPSETDPNAQKPVSTQISKPAVDDSVSLDDIEMKMNELHGIPFVERPPHELPKILKPEIKTYSKADKTKPVSIVSKTANTNYTTCEPKLVKGLDSDEEIIEHEPITGDLDLKMKPVPLKVTSEANKNVTVKSKNAVADKQASNKEAEIITETEFDKFARRNSITYENCLTVNFDCKESQNVVQTIKGKDLAQKVNPKLEPTRNEVMSQLPIQTIRHHIQTDRSQGGVHGSGTGDSSNKKYQSKIHSAYQSALTAKHQVSRPISIIEDKPVKVVFLESSLGFVPSQLNVQGQELSPAKKPEAESDTHITANNDSVDSGMSEAIYENKQQEKTKTKHQRKQVLTPVEAPDLELIQPSDIGIETPSKKKRKVEDVQAKSLVPKKTYLLGRNTTTEDKIASTQVTVKDNTKNIRNQSEHVPEHTDTASAIDNLVKAAELLENQAESANKSVTPNPSSQTNTPVKRGRGRPRKYPLPDGAVDVKSPSPQKKPRLIDAKPIKQDSISDEQDDDSSDEAIIRENWTMGKINENIVCPICNKLFRSENVVFKHVKHCTGVSPNRSESDKKSPNRSRLSQESDDMDIDYEMSSSESKKDTPKKRKSKESANSEGTPDQTKLDVAKDDVIVIEDTPIKEKSEKLNKEKEEEPKKEPKAKVPHRNKTLVCEFCGKTFRQQSYLTSHKLQHKKDLAKKKEKDLQESNKLQVFSCEVCKKEFRKLHHLVQHRINHNPDTVPKRALRKSSSEQSDTKNLKEDAVVKQVEDASAGFRCEPCDKSFRKLHHLVEHRGTHDGINRQKPSAPVQPNIEKTPPPPQCEICKKTFRKLHHLIEHKEQHVETSSDKSDDKSAKSALSTKDIIHECSLCYMVFPNEHSLNKHSGICSKKKRQSKQLKDTADNGAVKDDEKSNTEKKKDDTEGADIPKVVNDDNVAKEQDSEEVKKSPEVEKKEVENQVVTEVKQIEEEIITPKEVSVKPLVKEEIKPIESLTIPVKRDLTKSDINKEKETPVVPEKIKKVDLKEVKAQDTPKKKTVLKDKGTQHVTKRQKSIEAPPPVDKTKPAVESSDDDEIRYMLNPNFKVDETSQGKTFLKVRARKRNSLQIERPKSNDHAKRRTSLQLPPKVSRLKPKAVETKSKAPDSSSKSAETKSKATEPKSKAPDSSSKSAETKSKATEPKSKAPDTSSKSTEAKSKPTENKTATAPPMKVKYVPKVSEAEVLSTDSDDSDVKYSFPKMAPEYERAPKETEKKVLRKSLAEKRKSLAGIARRKSSGKAITAKHKDSPPLPKQIKRRSLGVEHRCDCGELFSSAALLARHASLAHTPPRIRRRRDPPPPAPTPQDKHKPTRKSSTRNDAPPAAKPTRKSSVKKSEPATPTDSLKPTQTAPKTRRSAHSGVPVPEKMRKLMQKNVK